MDTHKVLGGTCMDTRMDIGVQAWTHISIWWGYAGKYFHPQGSVLAHMKVFSPTGIPVHREVILITGNYSRQQTPFHFILSTLGI